MERLLYVWVWLPGATDPVVAGALQRVRDRVLFTYGRSYLGRPDAIALFSELPLRPGTIQPTHEIAGCLADAAPDSWGRRVIINRIVGNGAADDAELDILTYLRESGSDRIGALDFQDSPTDYVPRAGGSATLDELADAATRLQDGERLSPALQDALLHGSSVGGARPKALLRDGDRRMIAKFSSSTDIYPVVQAEFIAMRLAEHAGLRAAPVELTTALGKHVLLVDRFDRVSGGGRRLLVSALTILGLHEQLDARYTSYAELATKVRAGFTDPEPTLRELFGRITFNILVGNSDDHARNHAAFWDGDLLTLTPAYDICPSPRGGGEASQAMAIGEDGWRMSQLAGCVQRASTYLLSAAAARGIIDHQVEIITDHWEAVADEAGLSVSERAAMWQRQLLNPYAFYGYR